MNRVLQGVFLAFLLLNSAGVYALDYQFITHEGFSQTVNAFKVLSLIFNDHQFKVLAGVFAIIGLMSGGIVSFCRAVFAGGQSPRSAIGWMFMPLMGAILFQALILPKGKIHVYDKVLNQYQTIGGIPDLLVIFAGAFNGIEEGIVRIVSRNSADPRANETGPIGFKLLYDTMLGTANGVDIGYQQSIRRFYRDCFPIVNAIEGEFDLQKLLKNTPDIFDQLQHLWHPSVWTIFYGAGSKRGGDTVTCTEGWKRLAAWGNNPENFKGSLASICRKQGFTRPEQIPECRKHLQNSASLVFNKSVSADTMLRNSVFAYNIAHTLQDMDPDTSIKSLYNMRMINSGFGAAMATQTWMPSIKATVTAVILALTPFIILFMVTPFFSKVLIAMLGLFGWLTLWGVCDAILSQGATDQMISAFESVRSATMGLWALWDAPSAAIKALTILAQSRTTAMQLAAGLSTALFGISMYAFSGVAGGVARRAEQEGVQAAAQTQEPDKHASYLDGLANASASYQTMSRHGYGAVVGQKSFNMEQGVTHAQTMAAGAGGDHGVAGQVAGQVSGGEQRGRIDGINDLARRNQQSIAGAARGITATETEQRIGGVQGAEEAARNLDKGIVEMQQGITSTETLQRHAGSEVARDINQQIAEQHPEYPLDKLWREQEELKWGASSRAMGEAADWNSKNLQSMLTTQNQENFAATQARKDVAEEMSTTAPKISADAARFNNLSGWERNRSLEAAAKTLGMDPHEFVKSVGRGGAINNLSLSPEQLKTLHEKDTLLMPASIYNQFKDKGVVLNSALTPHGNLIDVKWSDNTIASQTTTVDNSLNLGNAASARNLLTDAGQVENILRAKGNDALYQASVDALKPIVSQTHQSNLHADLHASAQAGIGVVSAGGSIGKNWSDQTVTDGLYGNFSLLGKALQIEAANQGIDYKDQPQWVAKHYAQATQAVQDYYTQDASKNNVSASSAWNATKEMVGKARKMDFSPSSPIEQYLKQQNLAKAQEAFKAGGSVKRGGNN